MTTAENAARYLLHLAAIDREPSPITQMHLHKLLYFAQGWSLAVHEQPLFVETIEAWRHGPVVSSLRPVFQHFGRDAITPEHADERGVVDGEDKVMVESVWRYYRRYSASGLRSLTHRQAPWLDASKSPLRDGHQRPVIEQAAIKAFFDGEYSKACRRRGIDPHELRQSRAELRAGKGIPWEDAVREWRRELKPQA